MIRLLITEALKPRCESLTIQAGIAHSPFGKCFIAESQYGICHLSFTEDDSFEPSLCALRQDQSLTKISRNDSRATEIAKCIFDDSNTTLNLYIHGTAFQLRVWHALLNIPSGSVISYSKLAALVGNPNASRAVGTAVGKNPIAFLIPCHRVICESGEIGNYRWGQDIKHQILAHEKHIP